MLTLVLSHVVLDDIFVPDITWHFQVVSRDVGGAQAASVGFEPPTSL